MRSAINKTMWEKKQTIKWAKIRTISTAKFQRLNLKAPNNDVKMQSDKTLTTQIIFCGYRTDGTLY